VDAGQAAASDNPGANVTPRLSLDISLSGRFFWSAFLDASRQWRQLDGWHEAGALVLARGPQDFERQRALQQRWQLPESLLRLVDAGQATRLAGVPLTMGGLWFATAGSIAGPAVRQAWLDHHHLSRAMVTGFSQSPTGWRLHGEQGELAGSADLLFLANGPGAAALLPHLPLKGLAGQITGLTANPASLGLRCTLIGDHYLTPAIGGRHLLGSTYQPWPLDRPLADPDDTCELQNLAALAAEFPTLGSLAQATDTTAWNGLRCTTPDHLPLAGPLVAVQEFVDNFAYLRHSERHYGPSTRADHHGLHGLLALGSRAFSSAPLAAELVVSQALGEPWPLERDLALTLHPSRFMLRDLKHHRL